MPLRLPRFYAIIDLSVRPDLSFSQLTQMLIEEGVTLIQLRAKQSSSRQLLTDTHVLLTLAQPAGISVIVNDRADVAWLAGAAGVHLGQEDLPVAQARALLGTDRLIGLSTHTRRQVEQAEGTSADYLAFGPIFPTRTKAAAEPVVGLERLREVRALTRKPLVAIGGITPTNAALVLEAGADAVAVISAWLEAEDIPQRLKEFRQALGRLD